MVQFRALCFYTVAWLSTCTLGATPEQWRARSIYQVLADRYARTDNDHSARCVPSERVYCGGTYRGIIQNLDYIEEMGFSAIWISPITHNIEEDTGWGEAYHGYWQDDLYKVNSHFGTENDLKNLSSELHRRGMFLMVDIVVNHFAFPGSSNSIDYSRFKPFDDASFYHSFCEVTDYENQAMVEDCWLGDSNVELADVKTEDPRVIDAYHSWISSLVTNYSIDGLRIDTAKHVRKSFWPGFGTAAGVFSTGEVLSGSIDYACNYQNYMDSVLNYPIYYPLIHAFSPPIRNTSELVNTHSRMQTGCKDTTLLLAFASNHDTPRLASLSISLALRKNALAYTILSDGIPTLYQGDEQGFSGTADPENREAMWSSGFDTNAPLYTLIRSLNRLRSWIGGKDRNYFTSITTIFWSNSQTLALRRGSNGSHIVAVLTNREEDANATVTKITDSGYIAGTVLVEVVACEEIVVEKDGALDLDMSDGNPKVFVARSQLSGSEICQPCLGPSSTMSGSLAQLRLLESLME